MKTITGNQLILRMRASELANDNGKMFIHTWLRNCKLISVIIPDKGNWFYIFYSDPSGKEMSASISKLDTTCCSTFFGDKEHLSKYLKSIPL